MRAFRIALCPIPDQSPQGRSGPVKETLHPVASATGVVILARRLARCCKGGDNAGTAFFNREIACLITSPQLPVQPQFHTQPLAPHTRLYLFALNLIPPPGKGKRVIVG